MEVESLPVLGVLLGLLAAAGLARRFFASGWQKDALSVILVVLALLTAFMLFFTVGKLMRGSPPQSKLHAVALPSRSGVSPSMHPGTKPPREPRTQCTTSTRSRNSSSRSFLA
jgi:hypothetical protein